MSGGIDIAHLRSWIGKEESAEDVLTTALVDRFLATIELARLPTVGVAPRLIHFCLCQPSAAMSALGEDGHPARGGFLPPVPLPRRMWAGSALVFHSDLRVGERVHRKSRIADVTLKDGRSGTLVFVTVDHLIAGDGGGRIEDRQTIVYRDAPSTPTRPAPAEPAPRGDVRASMDISPTLLFRYSALTFNSHRIHYDRDYAMNCEDYPGLVVHGPLQATLLFHFAAQQRGRNPDRFTFSSTSPLFDGSPLEMHADDTEAETMPLWTSRPEGPYAMRASAEWAT